MSGAEDPPVSSWSPLDADERPVVWATGDLVVRESGWAGSYYCAHLYYVSFCRAREPGACIARARDGDPMVGFLHVPADLQALGADEKRPLDERHARTRRVVARALRGLVDELEQVVAAGPLRVLLTGFGPFPGIVDNPTGEFVRHPDNVVASVLAAWSGAARVPPMLPPLLGGKTTLVRDGLRLPSGRDLVVGACELPVDDATLDPTRPGSIHWALETFRPHALLAMGVHRGKDYRVEVQADSAGLVVDGGRPRHQDGAPSSERLPTNGALARAIERGVQALDRAGNA